ncbi:hypothetical protein R6Q57_011407 [Mikania cordata]
MATIAIFIFIGESVKRGGGFQIKRTTTKGACYGFIPFCDSPAKSSAFLGFIFPLAGSSLVGLFSSFSGRAAHISGTQTQEELNGFWAKYIPENSSSSNVIHDIKGLSDVAKIAEGQAKEVDGELSKSILENNKCYLLDCGSEVYVWVGRVTQVEERKAAMQAAKEFITSQNRPKSTRVTRLIQGYETHSFKSNFESRPSGSAPSAPEESRGKVAALLKQQGVGLKGHAKASTTPKEVPPLLEENVKIEVWYINGSAKTPVAKDDIGKFYSGDCYIVLYTYHSNEKKEDYYLCEDHNMAARLATTMFNSLKGRPVQGRVYQGKEPPQFVAIFQPMVVLKGGLSSGYKNFIADKGFNDETYSSDEVATSLNSYDCFLLQSVSSLFTWHGNQGTVEQHTPAAKIAKFLKPGVNVKFAKEGIENSTFWLHLGGNKVTPVKL